MIKYSRSHKHDPQVWPLATQSFVFLTENKGDNFLSFVQSKQNKNHKRVVESGIRKYLKIYKTMLKNGWRVTKCFQEAWKCLVFKMAVWTQSSSFQLGEFFMSYNCFSISQKLCSSMGKVQRFLYLVNLCTFFRRCSFVFHVLLRRDLKDFGWQRIQICIWHWMAVLEEDINHGIYSPKGGLHQCCVSTQGWFQFQVLGT